MPSYECRSQGEALQPANCPLTPSTYTALLSPPTAQLSDASQAQRWTWYGASCSSSSILPTFITNTLFLFITTMSSSSRKISSESFSSSVGSDCGLESPGRDGSLEATEESRGCPFSSFTSSHRLVIWNGRSSNDKPAFPAVEEQGPVGSQKRVTRRRRVNLDSLGESLRRLTSPMVGLSLNMI